ncbi:MAG: glycosyl transferase family 4 [gamma proteobacterium symbiont of Ctena orbiculata]|nr:glycosyltransferase family 4 protein [Candidatus Thiodiazotropha sp. (ex Lucina pensylvanica)]MBV2093664.1 glycosyltransferase family 4 protein [Candidatus Thiodiazotropha sp. (ex Codakia orbicularis)]PUB72583.1 MAG: glycosyl transferase family 4 [gamma proteobacterium symbiont of Ctena orbiculata]
MTGVARAYALRRGLIDRPNLRSSHMVETPRGGGIAFVLVYLGALAWLMLAPAEGGGQGDRLSLTLLLGGGLVVVIGFIDDHRNVTPLLRLVIHLIAAVIALTLLDMPGIELWPGLTAAGWWLKIVAVIGLVWLLNLYNFMDGIDGIASLQGITVLTGAVLLLALNRSGLEATTPLLLLAACIAGFMLWNWPPAKIFMGDAGSGFIGYALGVFALHTANAYPISLWSWLILLGLFVVDASWTLGVRMAKGEKWYQPHAKHAYQHLARRRQSIYIARGETQERSRSLAHRWVILRGLAVNLLWLLPLAWLAAMFPGYGLALTLLAYLPLLIQVRAVGAGCD